MTTERVLDVAVVGAGISGLATAFWLDRAELDVAVFEAGERVGGAMETWRRDGWLFEQGPNTVLESHTAVTDLLRDAGLDDQRLEASPAGKQRFLYKGGELVPLPMSPPALLTTPLFPWTAKLRRLGEPFVQRRVDEREETVADFVRRRLGRPILDYAVGPFVSGVWAGDPERLSVDWSLPRLAELERHHGSLLRGAIASRREPKEPGKISRPAMIGLTDGFESLARRLAERIGDVRTGCRVAALTRQGEGKEQGLYRLEISGGASEPVHARRVVLATSAAAAAEILSGATGGASALLADVPYSPVVVASLGFARSQVAHPVDGFGFLVPRVEAPRILGCLFPSSLFPGRAPEGHVALTAFLGGRTDPGVLELDDDEIVAAALHDLRAPLGLSGDPVVARVRRWERALPQYELGHGRFVERVAEIERDLPDLDFAVNWLNGTSVPDCIRRAKEVACAILQC